MKTKRINWFALLATLFMGTLSLSGIRLQIVEFKWEYMLPIVAFSIVTIAYASWIIGERSDDDQKKPPSQSELIADEPTESEAPVASVSEEKELTPA